ncbi:uncharacterized protein B0P05DRAFT_552189 [Gilbertella persicaria]|uniref:uncharacterized protein n=1 Tax=Gilbertella persicaria TaxID=101096 RepID=UPI00221F39DD|nr:uncharacterized protein B0P05DRAFT_552189 [Gilbertella persicaria]KAI8068184.1 hypothetical protein B0P05DRAFT_552189 [Gilbertella persicaria]
MNYTNMNTDWQTPLQEPVAFEDFQFSLGLDPEFAMPIPLDMAPPPLPLPPPQPMTDDFFFSSMEPQPPMPPPMAVLDEQDHKAFSQFLDQFFVDPHMQLDPLGIQEDEAYRQSSILQSLDDHHQKRRKQGGGGAIRRGKPHKELLTEEEKRNNHIASEQKRRSMIRSGFKDLTDIVPTLKNINNSKSTVLFKAVDYIKYLEKRNKGLRDKIKHLQVRVEVEGRMQLLPITKSHEYDQTQAALLQHKTQQKQLMELQEKLQLHQKVLAQKNYRKEGSELLKA